MNNLEETLREAASIGNLNRVKEIITLKTVDLNAKNKMNGWTALHWAVKREHNTIVKELLDADADPNIKNNSGQTPSDLTNNNTIRNMLGLDKTTKINQCDHSNEEKQPMFIPNYLRHPVFPYNDKSLSNDKKTSSSTLPISNISTSNAVIQNNDSGFLYKIPNQSLTAPTKWSPNGLLMTPGDIIFKVRISSSFASAHNMFSEVVFPRHEDVSYSSFLKSCIVQMDLSIHEDDVKSVLKLPNTVIKTKMDIKRLTDYQCLELVL